MSIKLTELIEEHACFLKWVLLFVVVDHLLELAKISYLDVIVKILEVLLKCDEFSFVKNFNYFAEWILFNRKFGLKLKNMNEKVVIL